MKWLSAFACAALLAWSANAATKPGAKPRTPARASAAPRPPLPTVQMYGHEFVDLRRWAGANGLAFAWDGKSKEVRLSNRSTRLRGTVSSRQLDINGVNAWLSVPITQRDQSLYLTTLDVRTLLEPVLKPARNKPGQLVRIVALDPGHGGRDAGNETAERQEKTHTLLLAHKVRALLQQAGLKVVLTRSSDTYVDLDERCAIAKRARADLFVSLHYNSVASGRASAKGVETFCITPPGASSTNGGPDDPGSTGAVLGNLHNAKSVLLAYQVQKAIATSLDIEDRGIRRARFAVLRNTTMPAILLEGGFMSAPDEARRIISPEYRNELARAIVDGILAYKRLVERK